MNIKSKDLFAKATSEKNLEVTEFYDWIEKYVIQVKHTTKYKKVLNMMKNDHKNKRVTERKVKNIQNTKKGIKYVKHFVMIDDYF